MASEAPHHDRRVKHSAAAGGRSRDHLVLLVLLILALVYYASYFDCDLNPSDEGYLCAGAERVLRGATPGADFHAYEPGRYWVLAAAFRVFGTDVVVERGLHLLMRLLICGLAYAIARLYLPLSLALLTTTATLLVPGPWHKSWFTLFMLAGFLLNEVLARRPRPWMPAAAGLVTGLATLVRLDAGVFTAGFFVVAAAAAPRPDGRGISHELLRRGGHFALGAILPLAAAAAFLAWQGTLAPAFGFYLAEYTQASSSLERIHPKISHFPGLWRCIENFPHDLFELLIWLAMLSAVLLLVTTTVRWRQEGSPPPAEARLALAWAFSFAGIAIQPDRPHFLQQGSLLFITAAVAVLSCERLLRRRCTRAPTAQQPSGLSIAVIGLVVACFVAENLTGSGIIPYYTGSIRMRFDAEVTFDHPRATVKVSTHTKREYHHILDFINENSHRNDGVASCFCLPTFNFLSGRDNPTGLDILFPHTVGSREQQQHYITALEQVRLFVAHTCELDGSRPQGCPPEHQTLADFAPMLSRHLQQEWQPVYRSPSSFVTIYAHRDDPLPAIALPTVVGGMH